MTIVKGGVPSGGNEGHSHWWSWHIQLIKLKYLN